MRNPRLPFLLFIFFGFWLKRRRGEMPPGVTAWTPLIQTIILSCNKSAISQVISLFKMIFLCVPAWQRRQSGGSRRRGSIIESAMSALDTCAHYCPLYTGANTIKVEYRDKRPICWQVDTCHPLLNKKNSSLWSRLGTWVSGVASTRSKVKVLLTL